MPATNLKYERKQLAAILSASSFEAEGWQYLAKEFAYNLLGWMQKCGMSHDDLSKAAGIHLATLTRIMRGNLNFGLDAVANLAHALGTSAYFLFRKPRLPRRMTPPKSHKRP